MSSYFEKGDYIVTLQDRGHCGRVNFCSKQRVRDQELKPEFDTRGGTLSTNCYFRSNDISGKVWRYATDEEAAEYERVGRPFDVTTLPKEPVEKLLTTIL